MTRYSISALTKLSNDNTSTDDVKHLGISSTFNHGVNKTYLVCVRHIVLQTNSILSK